ncbi:BRO family protein [Telmatospirillum sp.]|uniref:BRO-N domain-containing protein n=1 Tax=Telmatospirillum sp. TaxID=2079197 RepID=UPI002842DF07|nr:BRO family protein [Telmatospirillum sp.]MDR3436416.1 BRO family protein [Telmatospirillum sp.]
MSSNLPAVLNFEGVSIKIIDQNGRRWVTASDVGRALGYEPTSKGNIKVIYPSEQSGIIEGQKDGSPFKVRGEETRSSIKTLEELPPTVDFDGYAVPVVHLYQRRADEFTDDMTALVDLPTPGGIQRIRVFSPRGCHLIGMFSRTTKAKAFRRWVLDVLDKLITTPSANALDLNSAVTYQEILINRIPYTRVLHLGALWIPFSEVFRYLEGSGEAYRERNEETFPAVLPNRIETELGEAALLTDWQQNFRMLSNHVKGMDLKYVLKNFFNTISLPAVSHNLVSTRMVESLPRIDRLRLLGAAA